jgi:hypothetical protein
MVPVVLAAMAVGTIIKSYGQIKANEDQAAAEKRNAAFYREQAEFAQRAGDRKRAIFERESDVLYGDQVGAFAKAGVDTGSSSFFLAQQVFYRQNESFAIKEEADFNVRLAMLRADQATSTARALTNPTTNALLVGANAMDFTASAASMSK